MNRGRPLVVGLAIIAGGCGASTASPLPSSPTTRAGTAYQLYTHCGIEWARIDGAFWRAKHPLSDGNGNPPRGWGNPYQAGTLTMLNRTTAEFTSEAGSMTFERTSRARPPLVCS